MTGFSEEPRNLRVYTGRWSTGRGGEVMCGRSAARGGSSDCRGEWCPTSPTRSRPCAWCGAPISREARTCRKRSRSPRRVGRGVFSSLQRSRSCCSRWWYCRPSRGGRRAHGEHLRSRGTAGGTAHGGSDERGLPPGGLALPLFTPLLEDGFYRRQWNRYGPIYTTNMLYTGAVAVGGIELGRRILREHRDELRPPVFSDGERVEGGPVRNQAGERHRASRAVFARTSPRAPWRPHDRRWKPRSGVTLGPGWPKAPIFRVAGTTDSQPAGAAGP